MSAGRRRKGSGGADGSVSSEWEEFIAATKFFSIDQLQDCVNCQDVKLPVTEGYLVTALLVNEAEVLSFIKKFVKIDAFVESGYVRLVAHEGRPVLADSLVVDDELWDEECYPMPTEQECRVLEINPYSEGTEVWVTKQVVEVYQDDEIELTEKVTQLVYPVFARVHLLDSFDRMGNLMVREVEFHELCTYVKHPVQVW